MVSTEKQRMPYQKLEIGLTTADLYLWVIQS